MTMTVKDFTLLANQVHNNGDLFKSNAAHAKYASDLAAVLADNFPRFDGERFIAACTPNWVVGTSAQTHWDRALFIVRAMANAKAGKS